MGVASCLITDIYNRPEPLNGPALLTKPKRTTQIQKMIQEVAKQPKGWIVDELLRANPKLTDRKLLLRLAAPKLATMLVDALGIRSARLRNVA